MVLQTQNQTQTRREALHCEPGVRLQDLWACPHFC
jgi:hypothetical protein